MMRQFEIITALITPFKKNGAIEIKKLINLIEEQIENGITSFVLFGTTGEGSSISCSEKLKAIKKITNYFKSSIYLLIGISTLSTLEAIKQAKLYSKYPIDGLLVLTPTYLKTNEEGILSHFNAIAEASLKNVYLYHVPSRTGQNFDMKLLRILKQHPNIKGIKVASTSLKCLASALEYQSFNFQIYSGEDLLLLDSLKMGAMGIISVSSNIYPRMMKKVVNLYLLNQKDEAEALFNQYKSSIESLFLEPNPIGVKYFLSLNNKIDLRYRLPLTYPSLEVMNIIKERYLEDI